MAAPARLPGFHTCVGSGGERQTPEWYADNGTGLTEMSHSITFHKIAEYLAPCILFLNFLNNTCEI